MANQTQQAPQILLITAERMPKPDPESHLLVGALAELGIHAEMAAWTEDRDWTAAPLVVLRTPWDYFKQVGRFLDWARATDKATRLVNSARVAQWNAHKSYMLDLASAGVPIVPTILLRSSEAFRGEQLRSGPVGMAVAKPAVGVGAIGALKADRRSPEFEGHVKALLTDGKDVLVQPFVESVAHEGEVSLVFFGGQFSHAIRKLPAAGEYRVQDHHGGSVHTHSPTAGELDVARRALEAAPGGVQTYARVDLVALGGNPVVMELELIEPELFLRYDHEAPSRFARVMQELL
jgi:glutathione synthase/RimK-type ligase-like ATP-grasp enzyme